MAKLYQRVMLNQDMPEAGLRAGDVAWLIDHVPHPASGPEGCVLEIYNALGDSIAVVTVPCAAVEALRADLVPTVRPLEKTG